MTHPDAVLPVVPPGHNKALVGVLVGKDLREHVRDAEVISTCARAPTGFPKGRHSAEAGIGRHTSCAVPHPGLNRAALPSLPASSAFVVFWRPRSHSVMFSRTPAASSVTSTCFRDCGGSRDRRSSYRLRRNAAFGRVPMKNRQGSRAGQPRRLRDLRSHGIIADSPGTPRCLEHRFRPPGRSRRALPSPARMPTQWSGDLRKSSQRVQKGERCRRAFHLSSILGAMPTPSQGFQGTGSSEIAT